MFDKNYDTPLRVKAFAINDRKQKGNFENHQLPIPTRLIREKTLTYWAALPEPTVISINCETPEDSSEVLRELNSLIVHADTVIYAALCSNWQNSPAQQLLELIELAIHDPNAFWEQPCLSPNPREYFRTAVVEPMQDKIAFYATENLDVKIGLRNLDVKIDNKPVIPNEFTKGTTGSLENCLGLNNWRFKFFGDYDTLRALTRDGFDHNSWLNTKNPSLSALYFMRGVVGLWTQIIKNISKYQELTNDWDMMLGHATSTINEQIEKIEAPKLSLSQLKEKLTAHAVFESSQQFMMIKELQLGEAAIDKLYTHKAQEIIAKRLSEDLIERLDENIRKSVSVNSYNYIDRKSDEDATGHSPEDQDGFLPHIALPSMDTATVLFELRELLKSEPYAHIINSDELFIEVFGFWQQEEFNGIPLSEAPMIWEFIEIRSGLNPHLFRTGDIIAIHVKL